MEAYLDNSATTRVDAQVQELMKKLMDVDFGNHHVIKRVLWQRDTSRKQDRKLLLL